CHPAQDRSLVWTVLSSGRQRGTTKGDNHQDQNLKNEERVPNRTARQQGDVSGSHVVYFCRRNRRSTRRGPLQPCRQNPGQTGLFVCLSTCPVTEQTAGTEMTRG